MDAVGQQARADVECVEKFCEAQKILDEMIQRSKREEVSPFYVAAVYVALGDKEHGLEWLEKAYAERAELLVFLKVAPNFDAIHSDPRFIQIMQGIGLLPQASKAADQSRSGG